MKCRQLFTEGSFKINHLFSIIVGVVKAVSMIEVAAFLLEIVQKAKEDYMKRLSGHPCWELMQMVKH